MSCWPGLGRLCLSHCALYCQYDCVSFTALQGFTASLKWIQCCLPWSKRVSARQTLSSAAFENDSCMVFCLNFSAKLFASWLYQTIHALPVLPILSFTSLAMVVILRLQHHAPGSAFSYSVWHLCTFLCCCALYATEKFTHWFTFTVWLAVI